MMENYLTLESEQVRDLLAMIDQAEETLQLADKNYRPPVGAESNLTGNEVCDLLHISPRTLADASRHAADTIYRVSERILFIPKQESGKR